MNYMNRVIRMLLWGKLPLLVLALALADPAMAQEKIFFEAESMNHDAYAWIESPNTICSDVASNLKVLDGWNGGQGLATKQVQIGGSGVYRVWVRYSDIIYSNLQGPI